MGRDNNAEEFELNKVQDSIWESVGRRLTLFSKEHKLGNTNAFGVTKDCYEGFVIHPSGRLYNCWMNIIFMWSIYSTFFTPLEFGFCRGLPKRMANLDSVQIVFLTDIVLQFFVAYRDAHTYKMIFDRKSIALNYLKSSFALDLLCCFPWDSIHKATGRREAARYLRWLRLYRARKITQFFKKMEKDIHINYLFTRIIKLITVKLYCTHTAACIFYYLATTLPPSQEGHTWIGSLTTGAYCYINFREIDFWRRYITSLYSVIITMVTVGYGDIHAVNSREMVFIMICISLDMILGAYLIGNMTTLIVKSSKTERFRDKMTELIKYMNRNKLGKEIRSQVKDHLLLQYESNYTRASILEDIPVAVRSKISQTLYHEIAQNVPLFKGCSDEFLNQTVTKLNEEFFLPGEVILEQGSAVDQIYIISYGHLHMAASRGYEDIVRFLIQRSAKVNCRDKFRHTPLLEAVKAGHDRVAALLVENGANLNLEDAGSYLCKVAVDSKIDILRRLLENGVDPNSKNYDQRTSLHVAAAEGLHFVANILIEFGADVLSRDRWGNTPLDEGWRCGSKPLVKILEHARDKIKATYCCKDD